MKRRQFLKIAGGGITLSPWLAQRINAAEPKTADIQDLFESDNPKVLALAQRVFDKCIVDKLRPPVEPLQHTWVQPGGPHYYGQWIWDTMFVVDLLSIVPCSCRWPARCSHRATSSPPVVAAFPTTHRCLT